MTALAAAYARALAPAPGAKPKPAKEYRLKNNGKLAVKKAPKFTPDEGFLAQMRARAAAYDDSQENPHPVDLGFVDKRYKTQREAVLPAIPRPGFKYKPDDRLARPGPGSHTKGFALTHSCDKSAYAAICQDPMTNYVPDRVKVPLSLLVRRMMQERRAS